MEQPRIGERLEGFASREVRRIQVGNHEMRYEIQESTIYILRALAYTEKPVALLYSKESNSQSQSANYEYFDLNPSLAVCGNKHPIHLKSQNGEFCTFRLFI